eukprot:4269513-Pleurochrysis_carterae.AAC.1
MVVDFVLVFYNCRVAVTIPYQLLASGLLEARVRLQHALAWEVYLALGLASLVACTAQHAFGGTHGVAMTHYVASRAFTSAPATSKCLVAGHKKKRKL